MGRDSSWAEEPCSPGQVTRRGAQRTGTGGLCGQRSVVSVVQERGSSDAGGTEPRGGSASQQPGEFEPLGDRAGRLRARPENLHHLAPLDEPPGGR